MRLKFPKSQLIYPGKKYMAKIIYDLSRVGPFKEWLGPFRFFHERRKATKPTHNGFWVLNFRPLETLPDTRQG